MRLGKWGVNMTSNEYERFIDQCLEQRLNTFDHADIYGSYTTEQEFGRVLGRRKDLRSKLQLITKCGIRMESPNRPEHQCKSYDSSAKHIIESVEHSLINFQCDNIDLLLLHRPDYLMDPHEIAEAFESLKNAGKVQSFGVSNFTRSQVDMLHSFVPLVTNQIEFSLIHTEALDNGTLDQCIQSGIQATAWSPLGAHVLFSDQDSDQKMNIKKIADPLCEKYNCSLDQLLIAWIKKHPAKVIPVIGTTKINRIIAAKSSLKIQISHEEWYKLYQASIGKIIP